MDKSDIYLSIFYCGEGGAYSMKHSHGRSMRIRTRLFTIFLLMLLATSTLFLGTLLIWQARYQKADTLDALSAEAEAAMLQIESQLAAMNRVSLGISYSSIVQDRFGEILSLYEIGGADYRLNRNYRYLTDMLYSIIGPRLNVPQVYIYGLERGSYGAGIDNGYVPGAGIRGLDWVDMERIATRYFTLPHEDERLYAAQRYEKGTKYISLVLRFSDSLNIPQGYAEVIQRYDTVFKHLEALEEEGRSVYLFDATGEQIYPLDASMGFDEAVACYQGETGLWLEGGPQGCIYFSSSEESSYVLALAVGNSYLFRNLGSLVTLFSLMVLAVAFVMIGVGYLLTQAFTRPIRQLHTVLMETDLTNLSSELPMIDTDILELKELNWVAVKMKRRLNTAMAKELLTQRNELQTRVLALQAQTNPHFLYNAIFSIGAMASEGMNLEIERMCEDLGSLLRYSSSAKEPLVALGKELRYTKMYVSCMRIRFPDLEYETDVDGHLLSQAVPKLIVQLMVENAVKYSTARLGLRKICVSATQEGELAVIRIEDSGPGFDPETLEQLRHGIQDVASTGLLPSLEVHGMGILNVFLRIRLIFGGRADLLLYNREQGGAGAAIKLPLRECRNEEE